MYKYEYVFLVDQSLSDNDLTGLIGSLCSTLESGGAKILKQEYWGIRSLAYLIDKHEKSHYFMLCVEAAVETLASFKKGLRFNYLVLRYLELRKDVIIEGDSPMIRVDEGDDEQSAK